LHIGLTNSRAVSRIAGPEAKGEPISLLLRLLDGDGKPLPDGMIEIWQADSTGRYAHPEVGEQETTGDSFRGFGRMPTAENGSCRFETIKPGRVPGPHETFQAPHLNVGVFGRGLLNRLTTRIYFSGDSANDADPVLHRVPENFRHTLMARPDPERENGWTMDIHLCGENETVFFDV
jgi:protocatechuate 3,4-dioxygenase alpha subunit